MSNSLGQFFRRSRYLPATAAGLVLASAFPSIGLAGSAWIGPALLLAAAHGRTAAEAFRIGYVGGFAFFLAALNWLLRIPATGFPILGWLALSGFLALAIGLWVWLLAGKVGQGSWLRRLTWTLLGGAAWVALEMVQARIFSGFPWNFLGASQFEKTPLIQIAAFTGIYGVSFVVAWASLTVYSATLAILRQPNVRYIWMGDMLLPVLAVLGLFVTGTLRMKSTPAATGSSLRVAFIQPSIPQTMIWNPADNDRRFAELLHLTRRALTNETDLVLWPEAAVPRMIRYHEETLQTITNLAREKRVWMIVGSDDAEPARGSPKPEEVDYFNASFLISPQGKLVSRYCKRKLVPFGEYVPLARWLPFMNWFTPIGSGFVPGREFVPFAFAAGIPEARPVRASVLICFEDVFPHVVRRHVEAETDFLVNLTNDGWFGEGGEQWQHAASAVFRAVENGVPLLRCCNNGVTCWIDRRGVIRQVLRDATGGVHGAGVMHAEIPLRPAGESRPPTFYHRHGDWFGWSCFGLTALNIGWRLRRQRTSATAAAP